MKRKLLFAMLCIASALGLKAQTDWRGVSEITSGNKYYIVNDETGLFLTPGNDWGTRATIDQSSAGPITVTLNDGSYTLVWEGHGNGLFAESDAGVVYCDMNNQGHNHWNIIPASNGTFAIQLIQSDSRYAEGAYMAPERGDVWANIQHNSTDETYRYWRFISADDVKKTIIESEQKEDISLFVHGGQGMTNNSDFAKFKTWYSWTTEGDGWKGQNNQTLAGFDKMWMECWNGGALTNRSANQTIADLPVGHYILSAYTIGGNGVNLFIQNGNEKITTGTNGGNPSLTTVEIDVLEDHSNLKIGIESNSSTTVGWIAIDNIKLEYISFKANYIEKLNKAKELYTSLEGKVPEVIREKLKSVIEANTDITENYIETANIIDNAMIEANSFIAPYSHYQEIKTNVLDLTKQQVYTGEATPDVAAADAAVEAATTVEGINEAITLLRKAAATFLGAVSVKEGQFFTITNVFLENADFSAGNIEGWETNYVAGQQAQNIGYQANKSYTNGGVTIEKFIEAWIPSNTTLGDGYLRQIVANLPEGKYTLEADAIAVNQGKADATTTGALLYIEADGVTYSKEMSTGNEKPEHFEVEFLSTGGVDVAFGLQTKNTTANWICADNFEVKFYGVDLSAYVPQLEAAVAEAQKVAEEATTKAAYAAVLKAIEDYNKEWTSSQEYTTAIAAIQSATAAANALVAPKAEFIAQKSQLLALTKVEGYTEKNNATETFKNALEEAEAAMEEATETAAIDAQIEAMKTATKTFLAGVRSDGVHPFDITFFIVNASFDNNDATGWTANPAPGFQSYTNCEYFEKEFDIHQTLTNMPAGNYELKVQAFQRPGGFETVYNAYKAGNDAVSSVIYINDGETKIKNLVAEGATTSDKQWHEGNDSHIADGSDYYANSMRGAAAAFAAGYYENTVLTHVEGELTFGFKSTKAHVAGDWTIFDNFRLYFYGNSIAVAMDEAETFNAPLSDIEGANVTLKRTTVAGLNTVALPFDMDEAQVKEVFGDDAVVYTYSDEGESENQVTVNFTTAETKIEANVPVLVKASKATDEIKVDNVTVKAGEAKVEGNYFDFVANYGGNITLAEGVYFVSSNALYKSTGKSTLKGFRAMLTPRNVEENVEVKLFVDDLETSIDAIDGSVEAENGAIYNIAGQRVQKAVKGLYIVNGKKILVK